MTLNKVVVIPCFLLLQSIQSKGMMGNEESFLRSFCGFVNVMQILLLCFAFTKTEAFTSTPQHQPNIETPTYYTISYSNHTKYQKKEILHLHFYPIYRYPSSYRFVSSIGIMHDFIEFRKATLE